jgi:2-polyprenyl-3-methyl-5-hydroxy-6-metoxy-1,4-benzoquinol methylase
MGESEKRKQICDIPQTELERYKKLDQEWREYKIEAPAKRALVDARLYKVSDLRKISLAELEGLHGMGKSAVARLKVLMNAKKIKFRL